MKIGLQIPRFTWAGGNAEIRRTLIDIVKTAEKVGFHSVWVMDHFFQIPHVGNAEEPMLEAYNTLGFIAAVTDHVKLGTMVTGVVYRHPGILIKSVTTLDVLSGGRAYLGIGAAWFEREARGLGIPFPPLKERFEMLEETLQIAKIMWSQKQVPFHGQHYHLEEPINSPPPISQPHPPILIGGMGERKTLKFVAKYGDACNLFLFAGTNVLEHKLKVLRNHCQDLGKNYDEIEKTTLGTINYNNESVTKESLINMCKELRKIGIDQAIFSFTNVETLTPLEITGDEIIPAVADL